MSISETTIKEFQRAVQIEYGKELNFSEASEVLSNLAGYFDTLAKIYHEDLLVNNENGN